MTGDAGRAVNLHGTAVALGGRAVLIRGPSGAGKSDLALRVLALAPGALVAHQPMLVADDRVIAVVEAGQVTLSCPPALQGLIEVRGVGIVRMPSVERAGLELVVDLGAPDRIERLPEPALTQICGIAVRRTVLAPFESSAAVKLVLALACAIDPRSTP